MTGSVGIFFTFGAIPSSSIELQEEAGKIDWFAVIKWGHYDTEYDFRYGFGRSWCGGLCDFCWLANPGAGCADQQGDSQ